MTGRQLPRRPLPTRRGDLSWMDSGKCASWPDFTQLHVEQQKRICWDGCTVRDACREYGLAGLGLEEGRPAGVVYGGLSPRDLGRLHRLRREEIAKAQRLLAEVTS